MCVARDDCWITTDPAAVDLDAVHAFLSTSYWAEAIPRDLLAKAIAGSLPFSLFDADGQIGFARVVTDRATSPISPTCTSSQVIGGRGWGGGWSRRSWRIPICRAFDGSPS